MKFLIDENVRNEVKDFLIKSGHDVLCVKPGSKDKDIAEFASREKRIILTHDVHFSNILMYPPDNFSGIIRIKIHPPAAASIVTALKNLFNNLSPEKLNNKLVVLKKTALEFDNL